MTAPTLPPVTDAHRQQALALMGWRGCGCARDALRAARIAGTVRARRAKLSPTSVAYARSSSKPATEIAAELGVHHSLISRVRRGEKLAPYLRKGGQVTVTGQVSEREYEGKKYFDVRVIDVALQGSKQDSAPAPKQSRAASNSGGFEEMADDVPFNDPMKRRAFALAV